MGFAGILLAISLAVRSTSGICPDMAKRTPTEAEWYDRTQLNNKYHGERKNIRFRRISMYRIVVQVPAWDIRYMIYL